MYKKHRSFYLKTKANEITVNGSVIKQVKENPGYCR